MPSKKPDSICCDSCVFLSFLLEEKGRMEFVRPIFSLAKKKKLRIVASTMAILETVEVEAESPIESICRARDFYRQEWVKVHTVDRRVAEEAAKLRERYKLTPTDSAHLATAVVTGSSYFLTTDGESPNNKFPLLPLDQKIAGLRIITPKDYMKLTHPHLNGNYGLV